MGKPLDYRRGSSDYPSMGGPISLRSKRSDLERKLDNLSFKIAKGDGSVDIKKTNKLRWQRAIKENLPLYTTRIEKGKICYRVIEYGSEGLVNIKYVPSIPQKMK